MHLPLLPISFPKRLPLQEGKKMLAAVVSGAQVHLAFVEVRSGDIFIVKEHVYPTEGFKSLTEVFLEFIAGSTMPSRISVAFAGPVVGGKALATQLGWDIDTRVLSKSLGVSQVFLINDLEAEAYGLAALKKKDLANVYPGNTDAKGNVAIIAPGAGLGEAGLYWDGNALNPFATEGGHTDFAPRNLFDWELLLYLQTKFGHVSWERVLSNKGISQIYSFLRDVKQWEEPDWMAEKMRDQDPISAIQAGAQDGCALCLETLQIFVKYLAIEASNLALKMNATGGVYISGSIVPKIWNDSLQTTFMEHFQQVGRLRPLIELVPVYLVQNDKTILLGAAFYGKS